MKIIRFIKEKERYFRIAGGLLIILSIIFEIFNIEFYTGFILALAVIVVFLPSIIKKGTVLKT